MNAVPQRATIVIAVLVLCISSSEFANSAEFEVKSGWSDQLFPSFIIATATIRLPEEITEESESEQILGDPQGLLGVTLEAPEDDVPITVTICCDAIMEPSVFQGTLPTAGESYTIFPKIQYKYDELANRLQTGPVTVTYTVDIGDEDSESGSESESESKTLTLRSINDCPFTIMGDEEPVDVSFMFAAYVNEQHPFVDKILREALDTNIVDSFTGYQTNDRAEVYRQVYALWHALSERDLRYSSITTSSAESDSVASQHVRMIAESINNAQANCVDGSVLLASLLRKVGIEPVLVMVPGHCFLGFYLDEECTELVALETTLLGTTLPDGSASIPGVDAIVSDEWTSENSWLTFTGAVETGTHSLQENAEQFEAGDDADYQVISIRSARQLGILPIAFQFENEFVPAAGELDEADDDGEADTDEE